MLEILDGSIPGYFGTRREGIMHSCISKKWHPASRALGQGELCIISLLRPLGSLGP